jgi:hypothetical protein
VRCRVGRERWRDSIAKRSGGGRGFLQNSQRLVRVSVGRWAAGLVGWWRPDRLGFGWAWPVGGSSPPFFFKKNLFSFIVFCLFQNHFQIDFGNEINRERRDII